MAESAQTGTIRLRVERIEQLFNQLDPSTFLERDLRREAEEFIVSWAEEFPRRTWLELIIYVGEPLGAQLTEERVSESVRNYFAYLEQGARRELMHLLRRGRTSLIVGVSFLALCLLAADFLAQRWSGGAVGIVTESLLIGGWVAMWKPLEIYLYGWWPIRRRGRIYGRLRDATIKVEAN